MKTPFLFFAAFLLPLLMLAMPASAQKPDGFIHVRVSLKVVVDPATGAVPSTMSDALVRESFDAMNRWLAVTWRGYRLQLVDLDASQNFRRIGAKNDTTGPGKWYSTNLKGDTADNASFEAAAKASKTAFAWNDSAINIYMNNGGWSSASFPSKNRDVVVTGYTLLQYDPPAGQFWSESYKIAGNLLHELAHSFELYHTHGGLGTAANDDGIGDTALDQPSPTDAAARDETATRNDIAQLNYAKNYAALTAAQKVLVDNSANNAMGYHQLFYDNPPTGKVVSDAERFGGTRFVFTEQQMDKWADWANKAPRFATVTGTMRFVDASVGSSGTGTSAAPIKLLSTAVTTASAAGADILMLRPGTYNATTLSKPMVLRATRSGPVTLKKP
ncbi:MAG: hypothetical protein V4726_03130 [Verrucomicrobiota bacterium]